MGIEILVIDHNECLFENFKECNRNSCYLDLRVNKNEALVIASETSTLVGVYVKEVYTCECRSEPPYSHCPENYCLNGGICIETEVGIKCKCPDDVNYDGERCELTKAHLKNGFAWFAPLEACSEPTLHLTFNSEKASSLIIYNGPLVARSHPDYPKDFLYLILQNWVVTAYLNVGNNTERVSVKTDGRTNQAYELYVSWANGFLSLSIPNCGQNNSFNPRACHSSFPLLAEGNSSILNVGGPLQLGGLAPMESLSLLSRSYEWGVSLPYVDSFEGCISSLRYNNITYDFNKTSNFKNYYLTCKPLVLPLVTLSSESVWIIVGSLILLMGK